MKIYKFIVNGQGKVECIEAECKETPLMFKIAEVPKDYRFYEHTISKKNLDEVHNSYDNKMFSLSNDKKSYIQKLIEKQKEEVDKAKKNLEEATATLKRYKGFN